MKKKRNPDEKIVGRISKICKKCPLLILTAGIFMMAGALCAGSTFLYGNVQPQQYLKEHLLMPCWMQLIAGKDMDTESADQQVDSASDHFASALHSDVAESSDQYTCHRQSISQHDPMWFRNLYGTLLCSRSVLSADRSFGNSNSVAGSVDGSLYFPLQLGIHRVTI